MSMQPARPWWSPTIPRAAWRHFRSGETDRSASQHRSIQHQGSSVNRERQEGPHAHCMVISPDNRFAYAADLGLDKVLCYRLDASQARLSPNAPAVRADAAGRRAQASDFPSRRSARLRDQRTGQLGHDVRSRPGNGLPDRAPDHLDPARRIHRNEPLRRPEDHARRPLSLRHEPRATTASPRTGSATTGGSRCWRSCPAWAKGRRTWRSRRAANSCSAPTCPATTSPCSGSIPRRQA